ncbi:YqgE/AlgH family protein [Chitinophaga sp.]|uniref:YqgE/AlgH family protein n=1 Tax=Chitinophaga sp. TaxID=1869181 RepID=UPI002F94C4C6
MYISATALLDDSFFEQAILVIAECNEKGAMGFVINKVFPRRFNELEEFKHSIPFPLYEGGPVDQEHLYFVHRRPDLIGGGVLVADDLYLGGDFKAAVTQLNNKTISVDDIRLFIGYCGWDAQELEAEIAEGSWEVLAHEKLFEKNGPPSI